MKNFLFIGLFFSVFLLIGAHGESSKVYLASLYYDNGSLRLGGLSVIEGFAQGRNVQPKDGFECRVFSFDDKILDRFKFEAFPLSCFDSFDPVTREPKGGCFVVNDSPVVLSIPYFFDAKEVAFYDPVGSLVLSVDVSGFSHPEIKNVSVDDLISNGNRSGSQKRSNYFSSFFNNGLIDIVTLFLFIAVSVFVLNKKHTEKKKIEKKA
jgi:hypothetical protein